MESAWIPRILKRNYCWPHPIRSPISTITPPAPAVPSRISLRFWAIVHKAQYCRIALWAPHEVDRLNISGGSSSNANGSCCRNACSQVPELWKAYRAGIHRIVVFSILMTRLPGISLINSGDPFDPDIEGPWIHELKLCLDSMRQWRISPPYDQNCICSVFGTAIRRSTRVPNHTMGPFPSEKEFTQYLLSIASDHGFQSRVEYDEVWVRAERIDQRPHRVTFIQGDFRAHNILVDDDGHLSGFLDWGVGIVLRHHGRTHPVNKNPSRAWRRASNIGVIPGDWHPDKFQ
ncbi:phosphotransferase family protein [Histoplasma capsulatum]|uniref:Phosphotransferase family protein n=1 Tax=Ajellomyces capsulatus TaxID=5037 RepID=A0A8A1MKA1_AJECA|nr:phosphotransferase family protein [Histoplasma capsulatum]